MSAIFSRLDYEITILLDKWLNFCNVLGFSIIVSVYGDLPHPFFFMSAWHWTVIYFSVFLLMGSCVGSDLQLMHILSSETFYVCHCTSDHIAICKIMYGSPIVGLNDLLVVVMTDVAKFSSRWSAFSIAHHQNILSIFRCSPVH